MINISRILWQGIVQNFAYNIQTLKDIIDINFAGIELGEAAIVVFPEFFGLTHIFISIE